jgi:Cu(I)/Ag(I) efflux system periplasmic protein CusF
MEMKAPLLLALALCAPGGVLAQSIDGEVTKIDKAQGRITLKHGEIRKLDMPPMTMVYRVGNAQWLNGVAVGDRVRFEAERVDGAYTVTALIKAPARRP